MLKVGVIGCGRITQTRHAPEYAANEQVHIVGFYDFVPARAEELAALYGGIAFLSLDELLDCKEIDAVSVCTTNSTHADIAIKALLRGKHVLCEKPMATTLQECGRMIAAAHESGKKLLIAHNQRVWNIHKLAKKLLDAGSIGKAIGFKTCFGHSGPDHWSVDIGTGNWFFDKNKSAFGVAADLGVHKTDLIRFLLGCEIKEIQAMVGTVDKRDQEGNPVGVEDNAVAIYRMDNGAIGTLSASWTYYGEENNDTTVYGTDGIMKICVKDDLITVISKDGERVTHRPEPQKSSGVIDAFVDSVMNDRDSELDAEKVLPSMEVLIATVKAANDGQRIYM